MADIYKHIFTNCFWFLVFLSLLVVVIYLSLYKKAFHSRNYLAYTLLAIQTVSHAFLLYNYCHLLNANSNETIRWYFLTNTVVNVRDVVTTGIIIIFLLQKKFKNKMQSSQDF